MWELGASLVIRVEQAGRVRGGTSQVNEKDDDVKS